MKLINWDTFFITYEQAVKEIALKFNIYRENEMLKTTHCPITAVSTRIKSIDSIINKCKKKNIPISEFHIEDEINDIAGIRVICKFVKDIDSVILMIKSREEFDVEVLSEKNFLEHTKESGYRSYHLIISYPIYINGGVKKVKCEIQIRTLAMDFWSTIEHTLKYKYNGNIPENINARLIKASDAAYNLDIEMGMIREEILEAEEIIHVRERVIKNIKTNIQYLYKQHGIEVGNDFNEQFFALHDEGTIEDLKDFNERLKLVSWL